MHIKYIGIFGGGAGGVGGPSRKEDQSIRRLVPFSFIPMESGTIVSMPCNATQYQ